MLRTLSYTCSKDRKESVFSRIFIWDCCQDSCHFSLSEKTHRKKWTESTKMFPNVISPSQLYQTYLRSAASLDASQGLGQAGPSPSFLVENLLRERSHSLLSRQFPLGRPILPPQPKSPGDGTRQNPSTPPFLKFGVNAILGSPEEEEGQKNGMSNLWYSKKMESVLFMWLTFLKKFSHF